MISAPRSALIKFGYKIENPQSLKTTVKSGRRYDPKKCVYMGEIVTHLGTKESVFMTAHGKFFTGWKSHGLTKYADMEPAFALSWLSVADPAAARILFGERERKDNI